MNDERVSRHCAFNVERAGLRIAACDPLYPLLIIAASIHGCGVDGVTGSNH